MTRLWLENLVSYSLQIAVVAVAGTVLLRLLQIRIPKVRLMCWQALIAACLLLPAIQPWLAWKNASDVQISIGPATASDPSHSSKSTRLPVTAFVLVLVGAGAVVRFSVLGLGFWRIRRYRRNSNFVPGAFEELQRRMGVFVDVRASQDVSGPVTFGLLRPVILLPDGCLEDESIACHELVHVRRCDWLFTVIEECILSVFWFHPAMWWMVAEIQLAREEAVDHEVVSILNSRDQYLESLLSLAASKAGLDLVPASPFLRKRHLQKRVASLLREVSMSRFRLTSSLAAFVAVLALATWLGVRSFPLLAAQQEKDSPSVAVHSGPLTLLHRAPVQYPKEAQATQIEGIVVLELSLSETGAVNDARVLSGPEELRKAALESVLQWHYANDAKVPVKTQVSIDFKLPAAEALSAAPAPPPEELAKVDRLILHVPDALKQKLEGRLPLREGDRLTQASVNELFAALKEVDEHLTATLQPNADKTGSTITIQLESAAPSKPEAAKRIRVGGNVQDHNVIQKVMPVYPPEAKQARIQGTVRFTATIGKDGTVKNLELVYGHPLLVEAAKEAVSQWIYRPTLLNGDPVEVITQIDINFTLSQ